MRAITPADLCRLTWISDPSINPDGTVAYTKTTVNREENGYDSQIWTVGVDHARSFTSGRRDRSPSWSPDGTTLAFIRDGQLWAMPANGGEASPLHDQEHRVDSYAWSPDGQTIALISKASPEPLPEPVEGPGGITITRRIPKAEGAGWAGDRRAHLFLLDVESAEITQLTEGEFSVLALSWSPSGEQLAIITQTDADSSESSLIAGSDVFLVDLDRTRTQLTKSDLMISQIAFSPDGSTIAFVGSDRSYGSATYRNLYVIPTNGGDAECLTSDLDEQVGNVIVNDARLPATPAGPRFSSDGTQIFTPLSHNGKVAVHSFGLDGQHRCVSDESYAWQFALRDDELVVVAASESDPGDLYRVSVRTGSRTRLTSSNDFLVNEIELGVPEADWYETPDGPRLQVWVLKPPGHSDRESCPAVLQIHGGPHGMATGSFSMELQCLAAAGNVVVWTNPRGSFGYGQEFAQACHGDLGGGDYLDLMSAMEQIVDGFDLVDETRLGVMGGSYGGFMTSWIVSQSDRFKAGVTERSISNWLSFCGISDIGFDYAKEEVGGNPWDDLEKLWERSPLAHVNKINSPLLIMHGEQDMRCPMTQSEELYAGLRKHGKTTELVRFPGANHNFARSGKPSHRVDRLNRIAEWFDTHL